MNCIELHVGPGSFTVKDEEPITPTEQAIIADCLPSLQPLARAGICALATATRARIDAAPPSGMGAKSEYNQLNLSDRDLAHYGCVAINAALYASRALQPKQPGAETRNNVAILSRDQHLASLLGVSTVRVVRATLRPLYVNSHQLELAAGSERFSGKWGGLCATPLTNGNIMVVASAGERQGDAVSADTMTPFDQLNKLVTALASVTGSTR